METTNVSQPFTNSTTSTTTTSSESEVNSDYDTFINMLMVEMENQDPLDPEESTDLSVQLATFSTVEQLVFANELLTELNEQIGEMNATEIADWLGLNARVEMPVQFNGDSVKLSLHPAESADAAQLVVRNSDGREIQRLDVDPAGGDFIWSGTDDLGDPLPSGSYSMTTESFVEKELIGTESVDVHDQIVETRIYDEGAMLVMASGEEVSAEQILGLMQP